MRPETALKNLDLPQAAEVHAKSIGPTEQFAVPIFL